MSQNPNPPSTNPKKPEPLGDRTRTARAKEHLVRVAAKKGKRLLVDLDVDGYTALKELLASGYGVSNREVVITALVTENKRISKKAKNT